MLETLRTESWNVVREACRTILVPRPELDVDDMLGDEDIRAELDRAVKEFVKAIR